MDKIDDNELSYFLQEYISNKKDLNAIYRVYRSGLVFDSAKKDITHCLNQSVLSIIEHVLDNYEKDKDGTIARKRDDINLSQP